MAGEWWRFGKRHEPKIAEAKWANPRDVKEYVTRADPSTRKGEIVLGEMNKNKLVTAGAEHSLLVLGATGSGKTQGVVIPNGIEWDGPVVMTSVKPDVIKWTYKARTERSDDVYVFDPSGKLRGYPHAGFSPLAFCRTYQEAMDTGSLIRNTSKMERDKGDDKEYWKSRSKTVYGSILFACARADQDILDAVDVPTNIQLLMKVSKSYDLSIPLHVLNKEIKQAEGKAQVFELVRQGEEVEGIDESIQKQLSDVAREQRWIKIAHEMFEDEDAGRPVTEDEKQWVLAALLMPSDERVERIEELQDQKQLLQGGLFGISILEGYRPEVVDKEAKRLFEAELNESQKMHKSLTEEQEESQYEVRDYRISQGKLQTFKAYNDGLRIEELHKQVEHQLKDVNGEQQWMLKVHAVLDGVDEDELSTEDKQWIAQAMLANSNERQQRMNFLENKKYWLRGGVEGIKIFESLGDEEDFDKQLENLYKTTKEDIEQIGQGVITLRNLEEKSAENTENPNEPKNSFFRLLESILEVYEDPEALKSALISDINPDSIKSFLKNKGAIYVYSQQHDQEKNEPLFNMLISLVIHKATEEAQASENAGDHEAGEQVDKLLLNLDELANMAPIRNLDKIVSTMRGDHIRAISVFQDKSQLDAIYDSRSGTIANNHLAKLALPYSSDPSTQDYVSRLIGETKKKEVSTSVNKGKDGRSVSKSYSTQHRPLITADQYRRLEKGKGLAIIADKQPALVNLRMAYDRYPEYNPGLIDSKTIYEKTETTSGTDSQVMPTEKNLPVQSIRNKKKDGFRK